ncbi:MAG: DUF2848 family protein [Synergistaceae bacterium]|nr:DUF2848 family protein [Synergistaceae bacterium]
MRLECIYETRHGSIEKTAIEWDQCVAIGYSGRDQKGVMAHINELRAIGVPTPEKVPSMYWIDPEHISNGAILYVVGGSCSGEVEFFAARDRSGDVFVTVASDHTDRQLETVSVSKAKQGCTKILAPIFWKLSDVRHHWDDIMIRSWVREAPDKEERLYQEGPLSNLLPPEKLYELAVEDRINNGAIAYFSGTVPTIGEICYKGSFRIEMEDSVLGRKIKHIYTACELPDRN